MIKPLTQRIVSDNSGAVRARCINILGLSSKKSFGKIGDRVVISILKTRSKSKVKKGSVCYGIIVRTVNKSNRFDGSKISFGTNSVVLVNSKNQPRGSRILGPISFELRNKKYIKIISISSFIL
jgi:large subunit ribosomal protein L14